MKGRNSKASTPPRFNVVALRKLAGDKVFERGKTYHARRQVEMLSLEPQREEHHRRKRNFMKLL